VLSGGSTKGASNLPLGDEAYKRAMWGIIVSKTHHLPLLFSGAGADSSYTESDAFLDSIKALNVLLNSEIPINQPLHEKKFSLHVENKSLDK
jgi:hypothetical protein